MTPNQEPMKEKQAEKLADYYAGKGCRCAAVDAVSCSCPNVDWTPKEVYELREKLESERKRADEAENELISIRETLKLKIEQKALRGCFISSREFTHYQVLQEKKLAEAEEKIKTTTDAWSNARSLALRHENKLSELREIIRKQREALEEISKQVWYVDRDRSPESYPTEGAKIAKTALEIKEKEL